MVRLYRVRDMDVGALRPTPFHSIHSEATIQAWADQHPAMVNAGQPMLSLGREIFTDQGQSIDNLFIDRTGSLVVLEVKRGRSPREVLAQVMDYGAFAATLKWTDLDSYCRRRHGEGLETAFAKLFGTPLPMAGTPAHRLMVLAESYDQRAIKTATYLIERGWLLTLLRFSYFELGGEALVDVWPEIGDIPEQLVPAPLASRAILPTVVAPKQQSVEDAERHGATSWILARVHEWLPQLASRHGWSLASSVSRTQVCFGLASWPLPLPSLHLRVDTYRRDLICLRLSANEKAAPGLRQFLEEQRERWESAFPARFEPAPKSGPPSPNMVLTREMPAPEAGKDGEITNLTDAIAAMAATMIPLIERYNFTRTVENP